MNVLHDFFSQYGITIKNHDLYQEAVTHNSFANEHHLKRSYERLEFLGDAVLQFKSSMFLYARFSGFNNQGELTKLRKGLVCEDSLAAAAKEIGLGRLIRLGVGEQHTRGYEKKSILADVFEAVLAALQLDLGESVVDKWLELTLLRDDVLARVEAMARDYKTELQELIQLDKRSELKYEVVDQQRNNDNSNLFIVNAIVDNQVFGRGQGSSKKEAEQNAARDALAKIKQ